MCHTVEIYDSRHTLLATAQGCVDVAEGSTGAVPPRSDMPRSDTPPPGAPSSATTLRIRCPATATSGQSVDFVISVSNTSGRNLTGVVISFSNDRALQPSDADCAGPNRRRGRVVWRLRQLAAGRSTDLTVRCSCLQAALRACGRVTLTAAEGVTGQDETCLEIRPGTQAALPPPTSTATRDELAISAVSLKNPVRQGGELTYEIHVTNTGMRG